MRHTTRLLTITGLIGGFLLAGAVRGDEGLQVGDSVPDFKCLDDQGQIWDSRDHVGKKMIVVYFYPADLTLYPAVLAYLQRIGGRPGYQRAMAKGVCIPLCWWPKGRSPTMGSASCWWVSTRCNGPVGSRATGVGLTQIH